MPEADDLFRMFMGLTDHSEEVRETYLRSPFGWPGGKDQSKAMILEKLPYRKVYVEHCGGSGIIFLNRRPSKLEVFNDRDSGVTAFFRVIKDREKMNRMMEWLSLTIHSREEFIWCKETWKTCTDDVERAARWYYMIRMSFGQQRRNFGRSVKGYAQQPKHIYSSLPLFPTIHTRFAEAQVENLDLFDCIRDYDSPDTVHYIDPPYVNVSTGIYEHEFGEEQHHKLCHAVMNGKGFFALSGYPNPIYDSKEFHWDDRFEYEVTIYAQGQGFTETSHRIKEDCKRIQRKEVLWIKY